MMKHIALAMLMLFGLTGCLVEDDEPTGACYTPNYCSSSGTRGSCPTGSDWKFSEGKSCAEVQGNNSGSGAKGCGNYYDRGLTDVQVKTQCQAAYAYSCQNHTQGVNTTCSILNGFANISSNGNPKDKCPYCD